MEDLLRDHPEVNQIGGDQANARNGRAIRLRAFHFPVDDHDESQRTMIADWFAKAGLNVLEFAERLDDDI